MLIYVVPVLYHSIDIIRQHQVAGNRATPQDIHLIFEYEKGDKWGALEAPRANRLVDLRMTFAPFCMGGGEIRSPSQTGTSSRSLFREFVTNQA